VSLAFELLDAVGAIAGVAALVLFILLKTAPQVVAVPVDATAASTSPGMIIAQWTRAESIDRAAVRWLKWWSFVFYADTLAMAFALGLVVSSLPVDPAITSSLFFGTSLVVLGLVVYLIRSARVYGGRASGIRVGELR
jgi:hypothetical protein